ncbi:hypothetical protein [Endozoicomonas ascidiicola]|uniref:hypothetical protein n=1 Tax=Endozoicomonas ascidiicola TaxID=1698521 RepID=UPI00082D3BD7|nr:hypothetical protein [Endozoicomonas ascidiicola]
MLLHLFKTHSLAFRLVAKPLFLLTTILIANSGHGFYKHNGTPNLEYISGDYTEEIDSDIPEPAKEVLALRLTALESKLTESIKAINNPELTAFYDSVFSAQSQYSLTSPEGLIHLIKQPSKDSAPLSVKDSAQIYLQLMFFLSAYTHPEAEDYILSDKLSILPITNLPLDLPNGQLVSLFIDENLLTGKAIAPPVVSPRSATYLYHSPIDVYLAKLPDNTALKLSENSYEASVKLLFLLYTDFMNDMKTQLSKKPDGQQTAHPAAKLIPMFRQFKAFLQDLEPYLPHSLIDQSGSTARALSEALNTKTSLIYDGLNDETANKKILQDYNTILSFMHSVANKLNVPTKALSHLRITSSDVKNCATCVHINIGEPRGANSSIEMNEELNDHMYKVQALFKGMLDKERTVHINVINSLVAHMKNNMINRINEEFEICLKQIAEEYELAAAAL